MNNEQSKRDQGRRVNWRVILGLVVSGACLYVAVQNLQPAGVWRAFRQAEYLWIMPAVVLYLFALVARTVRWQTLLSSERRIPLRELLPTMAMGRGANNIYPFRTGEIVRVLLLRQRNAVSAAAGLASILVERVFDGLTMILFILVAAVIGGIPEAQEIQILEQTVEIDLRLLLWLAIGVFGTALGVVYALVLWPEPIQRLAGWFIDRLIPQRLRSQMCGIAESFVQGFSSVKSIWTLTLVLFFSITVWAAETLSYRLLMNSFGFGVGLRHLLLMSGAANLATALPSGPGNLGTFDAPAILVLTQVGIAENTAISYQTLLHAILWCTETFAGLGFMWHSGLRKADLDRTLAGQPNS
ncbi:MAG: lysylphosphatidylglycerol synthase transmembrane domain-containing protein [Chloroflexota bacterium]|nr:lysylphosphatidylglycerol synthase transmembrane domain-containing protein [Chloroflexota bacterium]